MILGLDTWKFAVAILSIVVFFISFWWWIYSIDNRGENVKDWLNKKVGD